jgi:CrcB protein
MIKIIAVALGGCIGAVLRYLVTILFVKLFGDKFPFGTLFVNVTGSFILGFFVMYLSRFIQSADVWRLFVGIGIMGAFTTFSTFSFDTVMFLRDGKILQSLFNILSNTVLSITACYLGVMLAK